MIGCDSDNEQLTVRLFGTANDSIVDGVGLRAAVFVQGCSHNCPGCHNPESHPYDGGTLATVKSIVAGIAKNKLIQGVTLSGGEPFDQARACAAIGRACKEQLRLNVWTYTGYRLEGLMRVAYGESGGASVWAAADNAPLSSHEIDNDPSMPLACTSNRLVPDDVRALLEVTDVLVDGPFVQSLKSYDLKWKGSSNQRVIDVKASRRAERVVLWQSWEDFPTKPENW